MKHCVVLLVLILILILAVSLPARAEQSEELFGDDLYTGSNRVALRFYTSGNDEGVTLVRTYAPCGREELIRRVVTDLLYPGIGEAALPLPEGIAVREVGISERLVILDLAKGAKELSDELRFDLIRSITQTLCGTDGCDAVLTLFEGTAASLYGLPVGAAAPDMLEGRLTWQTRSKRAAEGFTLVLPVWWPSADGKCLCGELRTLQTQPDRLTEDVLRLWEEGPGGNEEVTLGPGYSVVGSKGSVLILEAADIPADRRVCEALACTFFHCIPGIDGVRFCAKDGTELAFCSPEERLMPFGTVLHYLVPAEGGGVCVRSCAADELSAQSPRYMIARMLAYRTDEGTGFLPDTITDTDLLGVRIADGTAVLNWSARFYAACQSLYPAEESRLVYAIVNTLCQSDRIRSVRFLIEGCETQRLADTIWIMNELLPTCTDLGT